MNPTGHELPGPELSAAGGQPDRSSEVTTAVNRLVRDRTGSMLTDLRVRVHAAHAEPGADGAGGGDYRVELTGRCGSFYGKQLAGVAAMAAAPGGVVRNHIRVAA